MAIAAQKYQDQLKRISKNVKEGYNYFKDNYQRFNYFKRFIHLSSLTENDLNILEQLKKPQIEFNITEAYISRLLGEFAKQEPSISVSSLNSTPNPQTPVLVKFLEDHIRYILLDAKDHHSLQYNIYRNMLSGGYDVLEVCTEYDHSMSFDQVIRLKRVFDATMCFFDPLAREITKWDGNYCGKLTAMTKEDFNRQYKGIDISAMNFAKEFEGFNWSYQNLDKDILIICDYYEKKKEKVKIVKTVDGEVIRMDEYQDRIKNWSSLEPPPALVGKERWTEIETICRYRLIESLVLEYEEIDFAYFPLVFFDGNSVEVQSSEEGAIKQVTRSYAHHLEGLQRLKNFAGQTLANELENMIQHKWKVSEDSLPSSELALEAYKNPALSNVLLYKEFKDNDPNIRLSPPLEVQRVQTPPEVTNTFVSADQMVQAILGSYDAAMGNLSKSQLSGIALVESATQSNAAAMPYIVGFLQGLNQAAQIIIDLIPKYYVTPRTLPTKSADGKTNFVTINRQNGLHKAYSPQTLQVKVEAGVNFAVQKSRALQQIIGLANAMPVFGEFINFVGLEVLLDNLEIRGIDQLKVMATQFMRQKQQQMKIQQQMAMQNNPMALKQQELGIRQQQMQQDKELELAKLNQNNIELQSEALDRHQDRLVEAAKIESENLKTMAQARTDLQDLAHQHAKSIAQHHLNVTDTLHQHAHDIAQLAQQNAIQQAQLENSPSQNIGETQNGQT